MPDTIPTLSRVHPALARAVPGGGTTLAEGRRAFARATDDGIAIHVDGRVLATGVEPGAGSVANTLVAPGLVRREWVGPTGTFTESVLVAPTLPLVCVQWDGPSLPAPRVSLAEDPAAGPESDGSILLPLDDGRLAVIVASPRSCALRPSGPSGACALEPPREGGPLSLLVAAGTPAEVRASLRAAAHLAGHALRAGAAPDEGLVLHTGVDDLDDAVTWARSRTTTRCFALAASLPSASPPSRSSRRGVLLHALSALAAGDTDAARALHAALPEGGAEKALTAARIAAVTGDQGPALAAARSLGPTLTDDDAWAVALPALADALRYAAPDDELVRLRRLRPASSGRPLPMTGAGGRRLPMAGGPVGPGASRDGDAPFDLASLVAGEVPPFPRDPEAGWASWRARLAGGLDRGPDGPATWDPPVVAGRSFTTDAARVVLELAHGILGIVPDAPVGRIRVAPRLPKHVRSFEVRGIAVGDARLTLSCERTKDLDRFRVEPEAGSVPPLLVLEPLVEGEVRRMRVDGADAPLERRASGPRTVVPVQLPVDDVRILEIERVPTP
jgi:hypothetical protein